jgi:hypothetical protein
MGKLEGVVGPSQGDRETGMLFSPLIKHSGLSVYTIASFFLVVTGIALPLVARLHVVKSI